MRPRLKYFYTGCGCDLVLDIAIRDVDATIQGVDATSFGIVSLRDVDATSFRIFLSGCGCALVWNISIHGVDATSFKVFLYGMWMRPCLEYLCTGCECDLV
jgi:hypothetical protein